MDQLTEGEDFYFNDNGFVVFTAQYHLAKGVCCGNGCLHCPYQYEHVPEPKRSLLLASASVLNTTRPGENEN